MNEQEAIKYLRSKGYSVTQLSEHQKAIDKIMVAYDEMNREQKKRFNTVRYDACIYTRI